MNESVSLQFYTNTDIYDSKQKFHVSMVDLEFLILGQKIMVMAIVEFNINTFIANFCFLYSFFIIR